MAEKHANPAGRETQADPPPTQPTHPDGQELSDASLDGVTGGAVIGGGSDVVKVRHDEIKGRMGNVR